MTDHRLTLGGFIDEVGTRYADRQALVFEDRSMSYGELRQLVRSCARGLLALGVTKGMRVAILMANRPEWIIACCGAGMCGAVVVPVNTFASSEEREYILRHSDAAVLVVQEQLLKHRYLDDLFTQFPRLAAGQPVAELPFLRHIVRLPAAGSPSGARTPSWDDLLASAETTPEPLLDAVAAQVHETDEAMIIYTSGTTAQPKGVLHVHRAPALQSWRWVDQLRLNADDRVWSVHPYFWTAGFSMVLGATLAAGATLVMQETFDAAIALELIEQQKVTTVHSWLHQEAGLAEHPDAKRRNLSSLKRLSANSPLRKLLGKTQDDWDPGAAYGLSETFTIATSLPSDSPAEIRRTTHGLPLPGMLIRIVDPHTGKQLPTGDVGEIAVKGVALMRGYYKVPPEEYLDDNGFFRTRDAGWIDDNGYLHWTGRLSGLIKTGGANVSPVEVEVALARWGVFQTALVVGVPHPTLGEAVVACAVPKANTPPPTEDEVREYLRLHLASYKVPRRVLLFDKETLSFTGNDKVQLEPLRALAMERLRAESTQDQRRDALVWP